MVNNPRLHSAFVKPLFFSLSLLYCVCILRRSHEPPVLFITNAWRISVTKYLTHGTHLPVLSRNCALNAQTSYRTCWHTKT